MSQYWDSRHQTTYTDTIRQPGHHRSTLITTVRGVQYKNLIWSRPAFHLWFYVHSFQFEDLSLVVCVFFNHKYLIDSLFLFSQTDSDIFLSKLGVFRSNPFTVWVCLKFSEFITRAGGWSEINFSELTAVTAAPSAAVAAEHWLKILSLSPDKNIWIQFCSNQERGELCRVFIVSAGVHHSHRGLGAFEEMNRSISMFSLNSFNHCFLRQLRQLRQLWIREESLILKTLPEFSELQHTAQLCSENWNLITTDHRPESGFPEVSFFEQVLFNGKEEIFSKDPAMALCRAFGVYSLWAAAYKYEIFT